MLSRAFFIMRNCNDQFTPQASPTLGNKRYVNDHSHLKFLMKTPCQVTLMTHSTRHLSHPWKQMKC
ncbi:unnamed protein product [Staurois parvus]|uniref:Uncharacterized protein n=1 Tax=Staurois parvus TaxID=386267 RepID=A0ABN9FEY0_9NEOB|nr:unnamed protein product [Staurois parvus]